MRKFSDKTAVLQHFYGYRTFRPGQEALIDSILSGRDTLGILPTGGGKSICYQIPALLLPGLTIVVSPLISLIRDQTLSLRKRGIPAAALVSGMTAAEREAVLRDAAGGRLKLLYLAPERLLLDEFTEFSKRLRVSLLCVDEAHCVSKWGREFRPSYLAVRPFADLLSSGARPVVAAFTATASPEVRADIIRLIGLRKPFCFTSGFDRPNLYYGVMRPKNKYRILILLLKSFRGKCGIIYCRTRAAAEDLTGLLTADGFRAVCYHAGMDPARRESGMDAFISGKTRLIVATCAFGMGIDKPDVRFVIHYNMPGDVESYYQEAGRAGRDGLPSVCILFADHRDVVISRFFLSRIKSPELLREGYGNLTAMRKLASGKQCVRRFLLGYFGEEAPESCGNCSVCGAKTGPEEGPPAGVPDPDLRSDLRALRLRLARERGILPYRIFSDRTIGDLAARRPVRFRELLGIEGVNVLSCIKYGADFLQEIRAWNDCHLILEAAASRISRESRPRPPA